MFKNASLGCKLLAILVILGAINWGVIAVFQVDYIAKYLPYIVARIIYGVIGLAGLIMLIGCLIGCGKCEQQK